MKTTLLVLFFRNDNEIIKIGALLSTVMLTLKKNYREVRIANLNNFQYIFFTSISFRRWSINISQRTRQVLSFCYYTFFSSESGAMLSKWNQNQIWVLHSSSHSSPRFLCCWISWYSRKRSTNNWEKFRLSPSWRCASSMSNLIFELILLIICNIGFYCIYLHRLWVCIAK